MPQIQPEVIKTVQALKAVYTGNKTQFDFIAGQYISGDDKSGFRQQIIKLVTGEQRPLTKCSQFATTDALKNHFDAPTLF